MPKEFGAYLKRLRKENGLTIRELMKKSGVSNAYLSQLETGKRGMPSPDILMKIHRPLNVGYDELMEKAGYITMDTKSELHPETIQAIGRASRTDNGLNELIENAADIFFDSVLASDGKLKGSFREYLLNASEDISKEDFNELIHDPDIVRKLFNHLDFDNKIHFLNEIIKDFSQRGINPVEAIKSNEEKVEENKVPVLRVPVLGHIAAGLPILADEHIDEWIDIPNMWNIKPNEVIVLKVKGDSMIGSRIFDGDKVVVKLQRDVENGEIAVVNINGDEATLKRVKKTEGGQVILFPDNPKYDPTFITNENARIIGKVIQVIFEP